MRDIKYSEIEPSTFSCRKLIKEVIDEELAPQSHFKKVKFSFDIPKNLKLNGDYNLMKIIFTNVLKNAFQYSLAERKGHQPSVSISSKEVSSNLEIMIKNNGEKIPDNLAKKVFNMFFKASLNSNGPGLGLYTAKLAANRLMGHIFYKRTAESETAFSIVLPKFASM